MSNTNDTGHSKNVSNFKTLIVKANGFGGSYNPSNASIKVQALEDLALSAQESIDVLDANMPAYLLAVDERQMAFEPISKLSTAILNSLKSSGANKSIIADASSMTKKIKGIRITSKKTEEEKQALKEQGKEVKEISTSQQSYDMIVENFGKLISFLSNVSEYNPNEEHLKITVLTDISSKLKVLNDNAAKVYEIINNARIARNKVLYNEQTGLVDIAQSVKAYVKSVFNAGSVEAKQIAAISFKREKI